MVNSIIMDVGELRRAVLSLARLVRLDGATEITLVGAEAGVLSGALPSLRVTLDCDVIDIAPPEARNALENAGRAVARGSSLSDTWLSTHATYFAPLLAPGWLERRVLLVSEGFLRIFSVGRIDLALLKVLAGRSHDIDDLMAMSLLREEIAILKHQVKRLATEHLSVEAVHDAGELLRSLER